MPTTQNPEITSLADQYKVLASLGRNLQEFCEPTGIDLEAICKQLQIDSSLFNDFEARMSLDRLCQLLEVLSSITMNDTFGLEYGQLEHRGRAGAFGIGNLVAPDFRDMINFYVKYVHLAADLEIFNAFLENDRITIEWTYSPLITQREQYVDWATSATMRVFQHYAGGSFKVVQMQLERRAPRDKSLHFKVFSKKIKFGAKINKMVFPASFLSRTNPTADKEMFDYMVQRCETMTQGLTREKDLITILKEDFLRNMESNALTIEDIARRYGMSKRTLQRRLDKSGTGFTDLYEKTREELSMRLLSSTDLPLQEIAAKLGYSSQSAYTRAITRLHGKSPRLLRQEIGREPLI